MKTKILIFASLLVFSTISLSAQETPKAKLSYRSEMFIDGNLLFRAGSNLRLGKNLDIYAFGEFVRTTPLSKGAANFLSAGAHISYNVAATGTYLRVLGKRNFTTKENYGYFLAMQSIGEFPLQPTLLVDTNGGTFLGIFGTMYSSKWLTIGAWLNQGVNKGCPTAVEVDFIISF
ncbi:MAG: hypothetical protein LBR70_04335 [Lactobacillaceae bacterium]|jgi:hypothetical protein|nr:hypothetical protein [Lactobacillaceae bacterium]